MISNNDRLIKKKNSSIKQRSKNKIEKDKKNKDIQERLFK